MTKRSNKQEAWELLAPELPPGFIVRPKGPFLGWEVISPDGDVLMESHGGSRQQAHKLAWDLFPGGRQRYAEMTAIDRVREAARLKLGEQLDFVGFNIDPDGRTLIQVEWWFVVYPPEMAPDKERACDEYEGPTICDAAVACLRDLGALEVGQ